MANFVFNTEKFRELSLYLAHESQKDPRFGATKLNKLFFYIDFGCYKLLGTPATGATYQHLPAGPAPREWLETKKLLEDCGDASTERRGYFSGVQERLVANREPNMSIFSPEEMEIIDDVIQEFWSYNARRISQHSHEEWAWRVTEDYEDMPYQLAWVSSDPLTPEQIQAGYDLAEKANLLT